MFDSPSAILGVCLSREKNFEGFLDFGRLAKSIRTMSLLENRFAGTIDFGIICLKVLILDTLNNTMLSGTVQVLHGLCLFKEECTT